MENEKGVGCSYEVANSEENDSSERERDLLTFIILLQVTMVITAPALYRASQNNLLCQRKAMLHVQKQVLF